MNGTVKLADVKLPFLLFVFQSLLDSVELSLFLFLLDSITSSFKNINRELAGLEQVKEGRENEDFSGKVLQVSFNV